MIIFSWSSLAFLLIERNSKKSDLSTRSFLHKKLNNKAVYADYATILEDIQADGCS